jgi:hypothetical protein
MKKQPARLPLFAIVFVITLVVSMPAAAYSPPPYSVLYRMATALRSGKATEIQIKQADGKENALEERLLTVPYKKESRGEQHVYEGYAFRLPYYLFSLPSETYPPLLAPLSSEESVTLLTRIGRDVCYLLESPTIKLWVRKTDYSPMRAEVREVDGTITRYDYLEHTPAGEKVLYPRKTVVTNSGRTLFTETFSLPGSETGP